MSVEDLRAMLVAKDEMVKELEEQIKEMKQDAESAMMESDKSESEELAESKDAEELAEDEDKDEMKKETYKMSETAVEPTLLSEINALRESNTALTERLEKREAVSTLLRDGRITPAEETVAGKAWAMRELQPEFWQMFSERQPSSAVPLSEVGHGASGREITRQSLDGEVRKLAAEKSITYSEALVQFRAANPSYYNQAFGG
jgi:hypothetical protein